MLSTLPDDAHSLPTAVFQICVPTNFPAEIRIPVGRVLKQVIATIPVPSTTFSLRIDNASQRLVDQVY
jgi:hypothetical protein